MKGLDKVQKEARRIRGKSIYTPLPKDDTVDKIIANYIEGYQLTAKEQELQERYYELWTSFTTGVTPEIAKQAYMDKYKLSVSQMYRDVNAAMRIHGEVQPINKNAFRHILFDLSMKVYEKALNQKPEPNLKQMNASISNMIRIYGLDREDPEKIPWDQLQAHQINIKLPKHVTTLIEKSLQKGSFDIDDVIDITEMQKPNNEPNQ